MYLRKEKYTNRIFHNMLKEYSLLKSSPLTKLKWTKMMSVADEYAFHNDCLFSGIDEVISTNIQDAQGLLKKKLERVRKALERKEREKDVILKEGPLMG